jgi:hypothetical protein
MFLQFSIKIRVKKMSKLFGFILLLSAISFSQDTLRCNPICRTGFVCINGICVSKCNPPCTCEMDCDSAGNCITNNLNTNPYDEHWGMMVPGFVAGIVGTVVGVIGLTSGPDGYVSSSTTIAKKDLITGSCIAIGASIPLSVFGAILQARHERWNRKYFKEQTASSPR